MEAPLATLVNTMRAASGTSRRQGSAALLLFVLGLVAAACVPVVPPSSGGGGGGGGGAPPTYYPTSPALYDHDFPDPEVVVDEGNDPDPAPPNPVPDYHAFATNAIYSWPTDHPRVPNATASALPPGNWARGSLDALADPSLWPPDTWYDETDNARIQYWAPAVHRFGNTWVMYHVAPAEVSKAQCIGVATATDVDGPYTPVGNVPIKCDTNVGSIDPSVFVDNNGDTYLLWKNDGNCCNLPTWIYSALLSPDGLSLVPGTTEHALIEVTQGWEDGSGGGAQPWKRLVEGPAMVYAAGSYWLFYSANWWDSASYAIGYARCTSPTGGCVKPRNGPLMMTGPNGAGPGGPDVIVQPNGQMWLAYHAWNACCSGVGARTMRMSHLSFGNGSGQLEPSLGTTP